MISSMTGFGRGVSVTEDRKITIEIKSLNSKQFDLSMRIPSAFRETESSTRNLLAKQLERGKVELWAFAETTNFNSVVSMNVELLKAYKHQIEELDRELGIGTPTDWHSVLLRMPDALKTDSGELSDDEKEAFLKALADAVENLKSFRQAEGDKLYNFFVDKINNLRALLSEVMKHEAGRVAKIKGRLLEQLEQLKGVDYDRGRLEQELIYYIEKLDISEEKQRLESHLNYFMDTMGTPDDGDVSSKGKKLGFIAQEMGREINTLGSKSNNAEMQIVVVKMKDELEQIKEQVLNVL